MTTATIDELPSIPVADLAPEAPPRRGPGRPRKDGSAAQPRVNGKRADAAPKTRSIAGKIRGQISMLVGGLNLAVAMSKYRADALDEREMNLVTDALTAEAEGNARILKWMERAAGVTPHLLLLRAVYEIAVPRLARRGLLPGGFGGSTVEIPLDHSADVCEPYRAAGMPCPIHSYEPSNVTPFPAGAG